MRRARQARANPMARKSSKDDPALTHIDTKGEARMVDVSEKPATERTAVAEGRVVMSKATLDLIVRGDAKKGDVLGTARVAGIMAAKRTADLIPLCPPLALSTVTRDITPDNKLPARGAGDEGAAPGWGRLPPDPRHNQGGGARRPYRGHSSERKAGRQVRTLPR